MFGWNRTVRIKMKKKSLHFSSKTAVPLKKSLLKNLFFGDDAVKPSYRFANSLHSIGPS
jgi:hypothetical protein